MLFGLFARRNASRSATRVARPRLSLERLEEREVLASPASLAAPALAPALAAPNLSQQIAAAIPIQFTGISVQNGQTVVTGLLGSHAFTAIISGTLSLPAGADCPILHLRIDEIHLNVLGLKVDTSPICLDVNAESGPGNLLGNLLCGVTGLLDQGPISLTSLLGSLSATDQNTLTTQLTNLLNGVLGALKNAGGSGSAGQTTNLLHLSLGPVDLNLLGLEVHLDNCHNGPVTVDVSAQRGPGNLLGNLLSGVAHLLDGNSSPVALTQAINRLIRSIDRLL
jgi:hypothetical protein